MELDINIRIREKVHGIDNTPISWGKESVWLKLSEQISEPPRRNIFYFAAASVVLAFFLSVFSKNIGERKAAELNQLIPDKALNQKIASIENGFKTPNGLAQICVETPTIKPYKNKFKKENGPRRNTLAISEKVVSLITVLNEKDSILAISPLAVTQIPKDSLVPVELVHAIFGPEKNQALATKTRKEKKLHFRLFRHEDDRMVIANEGESVNLLARIN